MIGERAWCRSCWGGRGNDDLLSCYGVRNFVSGSVSCFFMLGSRACYDNSARGVGRSGVEDDRAGVVAEILGG